MIAPVAYLTDVEGSWDRLESFARGNPLVALHGDRLQVADGALFVFGGDAIDRGPASRRVVSALLDVRRRQPGQVVLLAGNRDINKLRLPKELTGEPPQRTPDELRRGPRADLLKWIFKHTMGAPEAFELRRRELGEAGDEHVVDSFLADLAPDGPLTAYLAAAQLAFRHGPTLFVHGGLSSESLGFIPGRERLDDIDAWIAGLNQWYAEQIDAFVHARAGEGGKPGFWPLVAYQAPRPGSRVNPGSVVYGRSADADNNLRLPELAVQERLAAAGLRRAVVGHTPSGDSPSIGRRDDFVYVMADNSHARHREASRVSFDEGGVAVDASVALDGEDQLQVVRFRVDDEDRESPIGLRRKADLRLVNGRLADGRWLTYRALPEWKNEQRAVGELDRAELEPPE